MFEDRVDYLSFTLQFLNTYRTLVKPMNTCI